MVEECDRYIQKNFVAVSKSDEFLGLEVGDILSILERDELHVESEEHVFTAMMSWVKKDTELRALHLPQLLKRVRMPFLTPHFISDKVASEKLIRSSHDCRDLIDEARDYFLMPERRPYLTTFRTRPRCFDDVIGFIFVVGGLTKQGDSISTVEYFDPLTERWRIAEAIKMQRSRVGVSVMRNRLYAIGVGGYIAIR